MNQAVELRPTACAICKTLNNACEIYSPNFMLSDLNPEIFSARRLPDRIHYCLVKCKTCGLVRSDPVADPGSIARLYKQSTFDYNEEIPNLETTYLRYLQRLDRHGTRRGKLLEIGCGNGFILDAALRMGYESVLGVEPSIDAVEKAPPEIRSRIVCETMRPGLFSAEEFDAICMFQVFDHIPEPLALLEEALKILKPHGLILCLNHNVEAISSRILRDKSPIIDIEHTYLFSPRTIAAIYSSAGFSVVEQGTVLNDYSLKYLTRLLPLPRSAKDNLLKRYGARLKKVRLRVPLGNLYIIAQKP